MLYSLKLKTFLTYYNYIHISKEIYYYGITFCIGNLALNQSCSFSEQCKGSPNASCLGGKCSCNQGYTAEESSHCVQSMLLILMDFKIW